MPDRDKVKIGDKVKAKWLYDHEYYTGRVGKDERGFYIHISPYVIGYLIEADEVRLIK